MFTKAFVLGPFKHFPAVLFNDVQVMVCGKWDANSVY